MRTVEVFPVAVRLLLIALGFVRGRRAPSPGLGGFPMR